MGIPILPQLKYRLNVSDKTGLGLYFSVLLLCAPACQGKTFKSDSLCVILININKYIFVSYSDVYKNYSTWEYPLKQSELFFPTLLTHIWVCVTTLSWLAGFLMCLFLVHFTSLIFVKSVLQTLWITFVMGLRWINLGGLVQPLPTQCFNRNA